MNLTIPLAAALTAIGMSASAMFWAGTTSSEVSEHSRKLEQAQDTRERLLKLEERVAQTQQDVGKIDKKTDEMLKLLRNGR